MFAVIATVPQLATFGDAERLRRASRICTPVLWHDDCSGTRELTVALLRAELQRKGRKVARLAEARGHIAHGCTPGLGEVGCWRCAVAWPSRSCGWCSCMVVVPSLPKPRGDGCTGERRRGAIGTRHRTRRIAASLPWWAGHSGCRVLERPAGHSCLHSLFSCCAKRKTWFWDSDAVFSLGDTKDFRETDWRSKACIEGGDHPITACMHQRARSEKRKKEATQRNETAKQAVERDKITMLQSL